MKEDDDYYFYYCYSTLSKSLLSLSLLLLLLVPGIVCRTGAGEFSIRLTREAAPGSDGQTPTHAH